MNDLKQVEQILHKLEDSNMFVIEYDNCIDIDSYLEDNNTNVTYLSNKSQALVIEHEYDEKNNHTFRVYLYDPQYDSLVVMQEFNEVNFYTKFNEFLAEHLESTKKFVETHNVDDMFIKIGSAAIDIIKTLIEIIK